LFSIILRQGFFMIRTLKLSALFILLFATPTLAADYVPGKGDDWEKLSAEQAGFDPTRLAATVQFAIDNETTFPGQLGRLHSARDLHLKGRLDFAREPFDDIIGPIKDREDPSGIVLRGGKIVAEWGDVRRVDMTHSVTKTFLSSVAGIAYDQGIIKVHDPVKTYLKTDHFSSEHNSKITWDHMLRQTSGWQGTLWGKPDWADRPGEKPWSELEKGPQPPGEHWKYNDVRVNMLALALLYVYQEPLPKVLKREFMDPIGASSTWVWHGYDNSYVRLRWRKVQSVSGGGHWGGGMFISARDLARLGLVASRDGMWGEKQILSKDWIKMARTPTTANLGYGYMNWFLNLDQKQFPAAPSTAVAFFGNGTNMVYVDKENDLVAVVRWIDRRKTSEFVENLLGALVVEG
jgi:CubicO group peptidase (beta-lactamase class C family)